jgi:hypothetical protein
MNIYLAIITTVLVVTQIIRVCQNHIQLRRQHILFKEQLGQLAECEPTKEDFETKRKAYRLIVEHFEGKKMPPPLIRETKRNVEQIEVTVEMDELRATHQKDALEKELMMKLGEAVFKNATVMKKNNPTLYTVTGKAMVDVLSKGD